jgi:hypothetical protein
MKLEFNKKTVQRLLIALVILIVVGFVVYRMYAKSTYTYPNPTKGSDGTNSTLYDLLDRSINQCKALKTNDPAFDEAGCISSNVSFYTSNSCPAVAIESGTAIDSGSCAASIGVGATGYLAIRNCSLTNWGTASGTLTTDLTAINDAYKDVYNYAGQTVTGSGAGQTFIVPASAVIDAAKRADVRAATRKYLAAVCGGNKFYNSNTMTSMKTTSTTVTPFLGYIASTTTLTPTTPATPGTTSTVSYYSGSAYAAFGVMSSSTTTINMTSGGAAAVSAGTSATATAPLLLRFGTSAPYTFSMGYLTGSAAPYTLTIVSNPVTSSIQGPITVVSGATPGSAGSANGTVLTGTAATVGSAVAPVVFSYSTSTTSGSDVYADIDPTDLFKGWKTVLSTGSVPASVVYGTVSSGTAGVDYYFQDTNISGGNAYTGLTRFAKWYQMAANLGSLSEVDYTSISALQSANSNYLTLAQSTNPTIPNWVIAQNFGPFTVLKAAQGTTAKIPLTWNDSAGAGSTTKTVAYTIPTTDPYA